MGICILFMVGHSVKAGCRIVRPLMSEDHCEAHRRVLSLYKSCYRFIPHLVKKYDIPKSEVAVKEKIREYFYKHACVTDVRVIDMLALKGFIELEEMKNHWQQAGYVLSHWNPTAEKKPCDFVSKFLRGED